MPSCGWAAFTLKRCYKDSRGIYRRICMAASMRFLKRGYRQVIGVSEGFIRGYVWQHS